MTPTLPEVRVGAAVADAIREACHGPDALSALEAYARDGNVHCPFTQSEAWIAFARSVLAAWRVHDHVVVRGLSPLAEGGSLLLASLSLSGEFKTYRGGKIVKTFHMSPWTTDLSHTIREGHFHTDLNTEPLPPAVTAIQCLTPDPGSPRYGVNRVARVLDLLAYLEEQGHPAVLRFLHETPVTMVNDRSQNAWSGTIVEDGRVRFHPETIRAATRRFEAAVPDVEAYLEAIHQASLAVSVPFWLDKGDILFVSNHRALHYRGECSVVFTSFPLEFQARAIHVLHKMSEPQ
jgi:hypothetical protein